MRRVTTPHGAWRALFGLALAFVLVLVTYAPSFALTIGTFTWSGVPIVGEREDFFPSGEAIFKVDDDTLTITLTNNTAQQMLAIGEVLTGLTWDITGGISLTPLSAVIGDDSGLVNPATNDTDDLSSEWAFRSDISAGSLGASGIGAMGDILLGADTFGVGDRFDSRTNLFGPPSGSLDGIDAGIVGPNVDFSSEGFTSQGPVVQGPGNPGGGQMMFTFTISGGDLGPGGITNVAPLFGSSGAPLVPEPATIILLGSGLVGLGLYGRKKFRRS